MRSARRDGEIDLLFEDHPEKRREFGSDEMVPAEALVEILPFDALPQNGQRYSGKLSRHRDGCNRQSHTFVRVR